MLPRTTIFRLRRPSVARGILLSLAAFMLSLRLGGFPDINNLHSSLWQLLPSSLSFIGLFETARCLGRHWSLYHAGVLILLYTELMILSLSIFLLFYP